MKEYFENDINYKRFDGVVNSWDGTPYRRLTVVKKRGADCALFIFGILKGCGLIKKIEFDYCSHDWFIHSKKELVIESVIWHLEKHGKQDISYAMHEAREEEYKRGDIIGFSLKNNKITNHLAIYLEGGFLCHSLENIGVHIITMPEFFNRQATKIFRIMEK